MKKNILLPLVAALALSACDYNDEFEGLSSGATPTDIKKESYLLTDADYVTISSNATNKAIAAALDKQASEEQGKEVTKYSTALSNLKNNRYFSEDLPAHTYLPAFLASAYPTADDKSDVKLTYNNSIVTPEYLAELSSASTYKVSSDDYKSVWGEVKAEYFTPAKPLSKYAKTILAAAYPDAQEGDVKLVDYIYSDIEPSTGGSSEVTYDEISSLDPESGLTYTVNATVVGVYSRGYMLADETGLALVYLGSGAEITLAVGESVVVKGQISAYKGLIQFSNTAVITSNGPVEDFAQPLAQELAAADVDALVAAPVYKYVSYAGTLSVNGDYYEVAIDGTENACRMSYIIDGTVDEAMVGQKILVSGYVVGVSSSKYLNTMVTSCQLASDYTTLASAIAAGADTYKVRGTVAAVYDRGFLLNDGTASILVYVGSSYSKDLEAGDVVAVEGKTSVYSGLGQFSGDLQISHLSSYASYSYPEADAVTGADLDAYLSDITVKYVSYTGTLTIDGTYYNVAIDGAATAVGSLSYPGSLVPASLNGAKVTVTGYLIGANTSKGLVNTMVTSCVAASSAAKNLDHISSRFALAAPVKAVASVSYEESHTAIYTFNGTDWVVYKDAIAVSASDYEEMGISQFSSSALPANYLPKFLSQNYPYAQQDQTVAVVYTYNGSKSAVEYVYSSGEWAANAVIDVITDKFSRKDRVWVYNPSVDVELTPTKTNATTVAYYQAMADWVWENIDQAELGCTKKGQGYVSSYGNNEYYTGSSAYYGNIDMQPTKAKGQYAAGYEGLSDEKIVEKMTEHLIEVMGNVLPVLNPDAKVVEGVDVLYSISVGIYTGVSISECNYVLVYKVTGDAEFEYVPKESGAIK